MGYSMKMGSKQNDDPSTFSQRDQGTINQAPGALTSFFRRVKNNPFVQDIAKVALLTAPVGYVGKGKAFSRIFKAFTNKPKLNAPKPFVPPTPSNITIQNNINKRIQNLTSNVPKVQGGYVPKGYKNYSSSMPEYRVGGKLYGHYTKEGKLTNKFVDKPAYGIDQYNYANTKGRNAIEIIKKGLK